MVYDVVGVLGRGGTGVVELAELADGTRVARKRIALHGSARQADVAVRRLRREAEAHRPRPHGSPQPSATPYRLAWTGSW